jgi:hypothetical protein
VSDDGDLVAIQNRHFGHLKNRTLDSQRLSLVDFACRGIVCASDEPERSAELQVASNPAVGSSPVRMRPHVMVHDNTFKKTLTAMVKQANRRSSIHE